MADKSLSEFAALAKQGKHLYRFWEHAEEIFSSLTVAQQLAKEANEQLEATKKEEAKVRAKLDQVKDEVNTHLAEVKGTYQGSVLAAEDDYQHFMLTLQGEKLKAAQALDAARQTYADEEAQAKAALEAVKQAVAAEREALDAELTDLRGKIKKAQADYKALLVKTEDEFNKEVAGHTKKLGEIQNSVTIQQQVLDRLNAAVQAAKDGYEAIFRN